MPKIKLSQTITINEAFDRFLLSKKSEGLTNKTLTTYKGHLACIAHHLNIFQPLSNISRNDLEQMISSMRESELSSNSIASYSRTFKSFLSWPRREGLTNISMPKYKAEEVIKETYTGHPFVLLRGVLYSRNRRHSSRFSVHCHRQTFPGKAPIEGKLAGGMAR